MSIGITPETVTKEFKANRLMQDKPAFMGHERANKAQKVDDFATESSGRSLGDG